MNKNACRPGFRSAGFTLIEVLIASAIMTASMGVLLQLFSSSINRMHRAGEIARDQLIEQQILQELAVLNPAEKNQGDLVIEGQEYHWQATLKNKLQIMTETQGEFGVEKSAGLYEISVSGNDPDDSSLNMHWDQLGWK
ncbi:MAG: prepilin-type N-terminal cleavage/methylation domain-containing protein [Methylococcales bacterium]